MYTGIDTYQQYTVHTVTIRPQQILGAVIFKQLFISGFKNLFL